MIKARDGLTSYLAAALRVGGPGCERAFLAREERSILRGTTPRDIMAMRAPVHREKDPEPRPVMLRMDRRAA
jgi:hypothetical protein